MLQQTIRSWIDQLLVYIGISADSARGIDQWVILAIIVAIGVGLDFLIRLLLLQVVRRVVKQTKVTWDDIIFDDKVLRRLCHIVTPILVVVMLPIAFPDQNGLVVLITRLVQIAIVIAVLRFVNSLLEAIFQLMGRREEWKGKPLKGLMQTGQVIAFLVAVILVFSILLDRSPAMFLTGLGASAAIFMLVFRDSILGFVSGIQLSANNMLKVGDWISMPKYGADGTVEEVTLNTVKVRKQLCRLDILTDICICHKCDTFCFHHVDLPVNDPLFQLHIRNTVHEQSADPVMTFKYRYQMPTLIELVCNSKSARTATDYRDLFTGSHFGRMRQSITLFICIFYDGVLIFLSCHRISVKSARTCIFAKCRADTGGKFREVICLFQSVICLLPVSCIYQIVPFRTQIVKWTATGHTSNHHAGLAERYAAVHAAARLHLPLLFIQRSMELVEVFDTLQRFDLCVTLSFIFHKACWFSHDSSTYLSILP